MARKARDMNVQYDPDLIRRLKKVDVRIRKSFRKRVTLFVKNPDDSQLNNHPLKREWLDYRSIDITRDWRVVYKEIEIAGEPTAYLVALGTHAELYG